MALWERDLDASGQPKFKYKAILDLLAGELLRENCLFFLGAGASVDSTRASLPDGKKLSRTLAEECALEWHDYVPLSTIAFYYEFFFNRGALDSFLIGQIDSPGILPSTTIDTLVEIISLLEEHGKKTFAITTNYDRQFENAYHNKTHRYPEVIIYKGGCDPNDLGAKLHIGLDHRGPKYWSPARTCLYKMHGCISHPEDHGLVITEEDYINFLANAALSQDENKRLLNYALGQIAFCTTLFVGYSLEDWNFRVIFKATVEHAEGKDGTSYAVQFRRTPTPDNPETDFERAKREALAAFWGRKNVDILTVDASLFMADLLKQVRKRLSEMSQTLTARGA